VKKNILTYILGGFFLQIFAGCVKPGIKAPVTLDKAAGRWYINAIRIQVLYGGILSKDSLVPRNASTVNLIDFDGVSKIEYRFNTTVAKEGSYSFFGLDSIAIKLIDDDRKWKVLLLTGTNFNIQTSTTDNNSFPGATVITFRGLER